jgi:uncharacterized protein (DUF2225 family)
MLKFLRSDTDLCRYFDGGNPYLYEINVCPTCGFSFSDKFEQKLDKAQMAKFIKTVSMQWKKQDFCRERDLKDGIEVFKLALLSGQVVGLREASLAGIVLRICWLCRMAGLVEEEKRFMKAAVKFFEKVYEVGGGHEKDMNPEIVVYLLGEMSFRLGDRENTLKWFNIAISRYSRDPYIKKQTIDMIKDRWLDVKEQLK